MKRYLVVVASVGMMLSLGGIYAWSAFADPLRRMYGYSSWQTQLVLGTAMGVAFLVMVYTGRLQDRIGPRPLAMASGVFLGAGYLIAAAGGREFAPLLLGYGVIFGLSIGCGYVCPIATGVKWFPHHKGLICGLAVAGYGGGAVLLTNIIEALTRHGWSVFRILGFVGVVYGAAVVLLGSLLAVPPGAATGVSAEVLAFRRRSLLPDRRFWALVAAMFCGTLPGIVVVGNLKSIGLSFGFSGALAAAAISAFAVGSAAGRIGWGFINDRVGGQLAIVVLLALIAASIVAILATRSIGAAYLAAVLAAGFCYGGNFALYPAQVAEIYGPAVLGSVYSLIMTVHGLAAITGAPLGGLGYDLTGSFTPILLAASAVAVVGWLAYVSLTGNARMQHHEEYGREYAGPPPSADSFRVSRSHSEQRDP